MDCVIEKIQQYILYVAKLPYIVTEILLGLEWNVLHLPLSVFYKRLFLFTQYKMILAAL